MAKISKTQQAIAEVMAATPANLENILALSLMTLTQQKMKDRLHAAAKARRLQFAKAPAYRLKLEDADYLFSAMGKDHMREDMIYIFVQKFQCDLMRGIYAVSSDGYRMHCVPVGGSIPAGIYHLFDNVLYRIPDRDAPLHPRFDYVTGIYSRSFLSKARIDAGADIDQHVYTFGGKTNCIVITPSDDRRLILGGEYSDQKLSYVVDADYLKDALTDRTCTVLFDYAAPVIVLDKGYRFAIIYPLNLPDHPLRTLYKEDDNQDRMWRRTWIGEAAAAFYGEMLSKDEKGYTIDGRTFTSRRDAIGHYAYRMISLGDARWVHPTMKDPEQYIMDEIYSQCVRVESDYVNLRSGAK